MPENSNKPADLEGEPHPTYYLNEAHKQYVEGNMASLSSRRKVSLEEALAKYDRVKQRGLQ